MSAPKAPIHVTITGAAGQIAYSLIYGVCKGDVFGHDQVCAPAPAPARVAPVPHRGGGALC